MNRDLQNIVKFVESKINERKISLRRISTGTEYAYTFCQCIADHGYTDAMEDVLKYISELEKNNG